MSRGPTFDECFREHYARLVALGVSMTGDRELGRDLAQESFLRLHRHWDDVGAYDNIGAWLSRVISNLVIDHHRTRATQQRTIERIGTLPATPPARTDLGDSWDRLLDELPHRQRVIVTLYYADDRAVADIADALEISVNTVKSALAKARDTLRSRWEDIDA